MPLYQRKPEILEFLLWDSTNLDEMKELLGEQFIHHDVETDKIIVSWLNGWESVLDVGEWLYKKEFDKIYKYDRYGLINSYQPIPLTNLSGGQALEAMKRGECSTDGDDIYSIFDESVWIWNDHSLIWKKYEVTTRLFNAHQILSKDWSIVPNPEKGDRND